MTHFLRGYFTGDDIGDMTVLLEKLLRCCGVSGPELNTLVDDILAVGDKYGLETSRYRGRGRRRALGSRVTCPGHILQVFVHSSIVDSVPYGSLPLGRLAPSGAPIS